MRTKVLLLSAVASLFIACGNENVEKVKNSTLRGLDTMTIGAAIEGSKICADIEYDDVSKDGLKAVKITCNEEKARAKARYDEELANFNKRLNGFLDDFKKVVLGEISDDEIKDAAKKYVTLDADNPAFGSNKFDKDGFGEYMKTKNLNYKNNRGFVWSNPLVYIAQLLQNKPKLPNSVIYELTFIIKPDGSVEPSKDVFEVVDGNKTESGYRILTEFYKR